MRRGPGNKPVSAKALAEQFGADTWQTVSHDQQRDTSRSHGSTTPRLRPRHVGRNLRRRAKRLSVQTRSFPGRKRGREVQSDPADPIDHTRLPDGGVTE